MTVLNLINSARIHMASLALVAGLVVNPDDALANGGPVTSVQSRETTENIDRYHQVVKVIRARTPGKSLAQFHAEPQLIDANAHALVTIHSVSSAGRLERFRCVATHDIAECLGTPVKIRYLPKDARVVLQVQLVPRSTPVHLLAAATPGTPSVEDPM